MVLKAVLLAVCCSALSLIMHLITGCFRKVRSIDEPLILALLRQVRLISAIWIFTFLIYALLFFKSPAIITGISDKINSFGAITGFLCGIIIYLLLSFIYLTFYYLIDRSVSATLLEIIDNSVSGKLTLQELTKIYDTDKKYQSELRGMLDGGFITKEEGCYSNSFKGSLYARAVRLMKKILKLGPGG